MRRVVQRIEQGWSPDCDSRPADESEWGVLKTGCVNGGVFSERENKALPANVGPIAAYEVRPGDVLMSRASGSPDLVGSTAIVQSTRPRLMLSDKVFRIALTNRVDSEFFVAVLNSRFMRYQIERDISGAEGLANNLHERGVPRRIAIDYQPGFTGMWRSDHRDVVFLSYCAKRQPLRQRADEKLSAPFRFMADPFRFVAWHGGWRIARRSGRAGPADAAVASAPWFDTQATVG